MKKARLLHPEQTFDQGRHQAPRRESLVQDLELDTLLGAMSGGDRFIRDVCRRVLLTSVTDLDVIQYRQDVLRDCLANPDVVRKLYRIAVEGLELARRHPLGIMSMSSPASVLSSSLKLVRLQLETLRQIHQLAKSEKEAFNSQGWSDFLEQFVVELNADYLDQLERYVRDLELESGFLISAELGPGNVSSNHILRKQSPRRHGWLLQFFHDLLQWIRGRRTPAITLQVDMRDESSNTALDDIKRQGIGPVANTLARSAERISAVLGALRTELAFYVGALNLSEQLGNISETIAFPTVLPEGAGTFTATGLYDPCLALTLRQKTVGNDVEADGKSLAVITGANQGGKTTFLRAIGLAQLMMQAGLFVAAEAFSAEIATGLFTHYRREEDVEMERGRLDEELGRINEMIEALKPKALVLLNESFSATNEREGSEIARQVISGLLERGIRVFFVTHLYEFAWQFYQSESDTTLFLRAGREDDGRRTYKMVSAPPLATSFGEDLYRKVFQADA